MADLNYLVNQIKGPQSFLKVRQAKVVAINANYTIDIQIAGDTNTLPSVKFLGNYAPRLNEQVWIITDGQDIIALGHLAPRSYPVSRLALSGVLTCTTGVDTPVVWASQTGTNQWAMWTSGSTISLPIAGYYSAIFWGTFTANATGLRVAEIQYSTDSGSTWLIGGRIRMTALGTGLTDVPASLPATSFAAGTLIRVIVTQTSGGNLDLNGNARLSIQYHGPVE